MMLEEFLLAFNEFSLLLLEFKISVILSIVLNLSKLCDPNCVFGGSRRLTGGVDDDDSGDGSSCCSRVLWGSVFCNSMSFVSVGIIPDISQLCCCI